MTIHALLVLQASLLLLSTPWATVRSYHQSKAEGSLTFPLLEVKVLIHCFTGTKNSLIDYLDLGVHIGLTGWVCDDRRGKHLRDFIDIIPDDKLLIETDSPYLSPYISSKKPEVTSGMKHLNKPAYLVEVAKDVAKYRNQSYDHICEITYQNYVNFFGEDK